MKTIMSRECPLLMLLLVLLCSSFCFAHRTLPESAGVHSQASRLRFVIADEPQPPGSYSSNAGLEQQIFDPQPPDSFSANAALEEQMFDPQLPDSYLANAAALKKQVFDPQPPDSYTANAAGLEQQQRSYYHHL